MLLNQLIEKINNATWRPLQGYRLREREREWEREREGERETSNPIWIWKTLFGFCLSKLAPMLFLEWLFAMLRLVLLKYKTTLKLFCHWLDDWPLWGFLQRLQRLAYLRAASVSEPMPANEMLLNLCVQTKNAVSKTLGLLEISPLLNNFILTALLFYQRHLFKKFFFTFNLGSKWDCGNETKAGHHRQETLFS